MAAYPDQESRPLKKPRLGPPDVYPQDPKQKEDELNQNSVKHGFTYLSNIPDEYGTERMSDINIDKFGTFFSSIIAKKMEMNTLQDTKKKPQLPSKDNFWPAAKSKPAMEAWFKDLAGNKPLTQLSKKVPTFNKKDEIFMTLCEYSVPLVRAAWYIKMTAANNVATQETRIRARRQAVDQSSEWTSALTKFLRDQLQKIQEHYHGGTHSGPQTSFLTATQATPQVDIEQTLKHWHYCTRLARHMYSECLLDRHECLNWLVELADKPKQTEDPVLKLILYQLVQYLDEITQSALLSRKLAHLCAKKLSQIFGDTGSTSPRTQSPMLTANGNSNTMTTANSNQLVTSPIAATFAEYSGCVQHRGIVLSLSAILQTVTLSCPVALVWNSLGEGRSTSFLCGSPLDLLPCAPSSLPMLPSPQNQQIRAQIRAAEHQIKLRGRAAEVRWSSDKCQQSAIGFTISKVLHALDILDRHNFERVESSNNMDTLYNKIFSVSQNKDSSEPLVSDEPIIRLLIDWAVSTQRSGNHRAFVVAKLLERRQSEIKSEKYGETEMIDDKDSVGSETMIPAGPPAFQSLLMEFLDDRAPVLEDNPNEENKQAFQNLVHLFCELVRHEVFSHDAYMCTLISRGDLQALPSLTMPTADSEEMASVKSQLESNQHEHQDDIKIDIDIHTMDSDLGSLFGSVKDETKTSPEAPASVKSVRSEKDVPIPSVGEPSSVPPPPPPPPPRGPPRHQLYATHFPIPQDEASSHECNQRLIALHGVGKARDEARHFVKKISKEISRLFSKRNCIDVSSGDLGRVKKKKEKEGEAAVSKDAASVMPNYDAILQKFQKLSYYDQHAVTSQCTSVISEHINNFVTGNSSYLPLVENISYLFDLMEYALNINELMEFVIQLLKELSEVEVQLKAKDSSLAKVYSTSLSLCIVGVLRQYHLYLLVAQDLTTQAFQGLFSMVRHLDVNDTSGWTSAEQGVLVYLYDLFTSCNFVRTKNSDAFNTLYTFMKSTIYAPLTPATSLLRWDPSFLIDLLNSRKLTVEPQIVQVMFEQHFNRYSFVCNAVLNVLNATGPERLIELTNLCSEITAACHLLSTEWLGVFKSLCCSSMHNNVGYIDILTQIDVSDRSIHDSLAVFTAILIARHCFSFHDFVVHVALPSLLAACPSAGDTDAHAGARLTCFLLLRLFKTSYLVESTPGLASGSKNPPLIRSSSDRHLLEACHDSISVGPVLAVLKAMLVLGDSCNDDNKLKSGVSGSSGGTSNQKDKSGNGDIMGMMLRSLDDDDDMDMDMMLGTSKKKNYGLESGSLSDYARYALREMCSQEWVRQKFLKDPESLFNGDLLMDSELSNKQAQQLVQMICYSNNIPNQTQSGEQDNKQTILRILQNLDQWSLRVSWLELQLMFKQATTQAETNSILDNIAKGTIDLFHQQTESNKAAGGGSASPQEQNKSESEKNIVWLVAPLISKLPSTIQGRVLKLAGQVLESGNHLVSKSKIDKEKNQKSKSLLGHQPFLSLVLTCLKGQDEQREGLLNSLQSQLEKFINNTKEILDKSPDESKIRQNLHEALQLRLSLVGGMFDTIQRNNTTTTEWAMLLLQLISHGVVDPQTNNELFLTVLDMLSVLIHGTLVTEGSEKGEEKKTYQNLIKKLRKELVDKHSEAIDKLRQLLPLQKRSFEVITCEPHGTLVDTKGNKIAGFDSICKKQGLQVAQKMKVSPWEVLESYKNPAAISWSHFGAIKMERKALKYEEQHRQLLFHSHSLCHPNSYYLEPPPLPPEDLEPPPEKVEEKPKEQSESNASEIGKKRSKPNRRRNSKINNNTNYIQQPSMRATYPFNQETIYQAPGPPPNWYVPPQQQGGYGYPQQHMPPMGTGPRFPPAHSSKMLLNDLLQARFKHPRVSQPYMQQATMGQQDFQNLQQQQRQKIQHQYVRKQILQKQQTRLAAESSGLYGGPMQTSTTPGPAPIHSMTSQQPGSYPPYAAPPQPQPQPRMLDQMNSGMMSQTFNQSYQGGQPGAMMQSMQQQSAAPGYMPQQGLQQTQPQFNPAQRIQSSMGGSGMQTPSTGMSTMPGYNQLGPGGPQQHQPSSYMQQISPAQQQPQQQHLQQFRQQRLMAMQQNQHMHQNQQRTTATLVAQLRQMQSMQAPPPPGPQYNQYTHY